MSSYPSFILAFVLYMRHFFESLFKTNGVPQIDKFLTHFTQMDSFHMYRFLSFFSLISHSNLGCFCLYHFRSFSQNASLFGHILTVSERCVCTIWVLLNFCLLAFTKVNEMKVARSSSTFAEARVVGNIIFKCYPPSYLYNVYKTFILPPFQVVRYFALYIIFILCT